MHRILIAEDDLAVRSLLQRVLANAGYGVETAADGGTAVEMVTASLPDLLITDLMMPGLTGWSVFARVRRQVPTLPILVMSGTTTGIPDGASLPDHAVFLQKPAAITDVLTTVTHLLAENQAGGATRGDAPVAI